MNVPALLFLPLAVALLACVSIAPAADDPPRPNIVVILCDDLGWGDLQNYGHPVIETPNLVEMASEGVRFTSFYSASPVCSPSRVGLLTGRNPNRAGVYDWIPDADPDAPPERSRALVQMRESEFTIPRMLSEAGYATCMSGKWHCNAMFDSPEQAQPDDHGFDYWFATQNNARPSHENPVNFVRNGEPVGKLEGYSCQLVADEVVTWLEDHESSEPERPFFAYVAYHEPHEPVASPPELVKRYEPHAEDHDEAQYFANVANLDAATGKLLDAIDELGYRENTLVIFTSDNGPETLDRYRGANRSYGRPGPWRGMKLHTHEAGYRVAGIMRWPARIEGGRVSDEPVCSLDFLPTFAALAGAEVPADRQLDGADFRPVLEGRSVERERPLFWIYYNALNEAKVSMRVGDRKVLGAFGEDDPGRFSNLDGANVDAVRAAELVDFELYDLAEDPAEADPLPTADSPLPDRLRTRYREAFETFHVWPAVKAN